MEGREAAGGPGVSADGGRPLGCPVAAATIGGRAAHAVADRGRVPSAGRAIPAVAAAVARGSSREGGGFPRGDD